MTNHSLQLKDGRTISYSLYRPGDGQPVLYFHGTPSSRLEPLLLEAYGVNVERLLATNKIQLIAIDRPGMGLSSFNKNGTFLSFADDCSELLNHLEITSVKVLGWSGAGPYLLAIASKYPSSITGVYILTGFTKNFSNPEVFKAMHGNKYYFGSAKKIPWLLRTVLNFVSKKEPKRGIPKWISQLPEVDNRLMENPAQLNAVFTNSLKEACRNGSKGAVYEAANYFNDFGFDLSSIKPPVHFWWGSKDKNITEIHPQHLKQSLPSCTIHYKPKEGHLSIYVKYFEEAIRKISEQ